MMDCIFWYRRSRDALPADEMNGSENGKPDSDYTYYIEVAARVNPKLMQLAQQGSCRAFIPEKRKPEVKY